MFPYYHIMEIMWFFLIWIQAPQLFPTGHPRIPASFPLPLLPSSVSPACLSAGLRIPEAKQPPGTHSSRLFCAFLLVLFLFDVSPFWNHISACFTFCIFCHSALTQEHLHRFPTFGTVHLMNRHIPSCLLAGLQHSHLAFLLVDWLYKPNVGPQLILL